MARAGKIIFGAVYDPIHDELFIAEKGRGTYLNGKKIKSKARENLSKALLCFNIWPGGDYDLMEFSHRITFDIYVAAKIPCVCLSACYTAVGRIDGIIFAGSAPWDVAATSLICEEAGLKVTELDGKNFIPRKEMKGIVIAKSKLHKEIMRYIKKYSKIKQKIPVYPELNYL